jgi:hypothetical protein
LVLLFPGFAFWLGFRVGSHQDYLSPVPDKPNSTFTLVMVLIGALLAHTVGAAAFANQHSFCSVAPCVVLHHDPNLYKVLLSGKTAPLTSDLGIEFALLYIFVLAYVTFLLGSLGGRTTALQNVLKPDTQGWIRVVAEGAKASDKVVTAFVLTKLGNDGHYAAYEGIVQQLTLDEEQAVSMLALVGVDRFAVKIDATGLHRIDQTGARPMPLMQFGKADIANVAFEIVDLPNEITEIDLMTESDILASY